MTGGMQLIPVRRLGVLLLLPLIAFVAISGIAVLLEETSSYYSIEHLGYRDVVYTADWKLVVASSLLLSLAVPVFGVLLRRVGVSLVTLFLGSLLVFHFVGAAVMASQDHLLPWSGVVVALLGLLAGASAIFLRSGGAKENGGANALELMVFSHQGRRSIEVLLLALFLLLLLYYNHFGFPPVVEAIESIVVGDVQGASGAIIEGRMAQYQTQGGYRGQGYVELVRVAIVPFGCLVLLADSIVKRKLGMPSHAWSTVAFVAAGLFFVILSGQRWPVSFFIISVVLCYVGVGGAPSRKVVALLIAVFMLIVGGLTVLNNRIQLGGAGAGEFLAAFSGGIVYRVCIASHAPYYHATDVFPHFLPYQGGATWLGDFAGYLPGKDEVFGTTFARAIGMSWGSAPLTFLGEAYANFGLIGLPIMFFGVGFCFAIVDKTWGRRSRGGRLFTRIAYVYLCIGAVRMLYGSGIGIVSYHVLPILAFYAFLKIVGSLLPAGGLYRAAKSD